MTPHPANMASFFLQLRHVCVTFAVLLTIATCAAKEAELNECERGVKRHHPSQANLYQIFTRKDFRKQWLDYSCPEFTIFDPRSCDCVDSPRSEAQRSSPNRAVSKNQSSRQRSTRTESEDVNDGVRGSNAGKGSEDSGAQNNGWSKDNSWGGKQTTRGRESTSSRTKQDSNWVKTQGKPSGKSSSSWADESQTGKEQNGGWGKQESKQNGGWGKQGSTGSKQDSAWGRDNQDDPDWDKDNSADDESEPEPSAFSPKNEGFKNKINTIERTNQIDAESSSTKKGECHLHRPSTNPSHFERWSDGQWVQEDCNWPFYTGLVWNQGTCRCEWGPNRTLATPMFGDSVPAACLMMLKMSFNGGSIVDEGRHIWLNIKDKENAHVESDSTAVGGKCGSFRGSTIAIPYFKSNVLGPVFHIGFMFKLCPGDPDTDIPLIHNDCLESQEPPGIVVVYQAWKKRLVVSMRTVNSEELSSEFCPFDNSQNQWVKIDIRYGENFLEVVANNEVCVSSEKFHGPVATNNCPLTLLGEAFCGKLDEVIITRGCTNSHAVS
ncbi:uncharacterized protein LOC131930657 [Physella acuta]|uniref:uncharacterized protein LOC131930657 n=1 Tax=Physella acuta TaxID=109671 RepID=UPI0027DE1DA7|nr:uncharacterized protein LOC131930657 [Physella acuta]